MQLWYYADFLLTIFNKHPQIIFYGPSFKMMKSWQLLHTFAPKGLLLMNWLLIKENINVKPKGISSKMKRKQKNENKETVNVLSYTGKETNS